MSRRGFHLAPPSPVPTGKGLRSSAINDEILSDFLTASLQIPNLRLPISFQSRNLLISSVDFRSILSGDCDVIESVKRSTSEFGFFAISGHGISGSEVQEVAKRIAKNGGEELREMKRCEDAEGFDFCWAGEEDEDEGSEFNMDPNLIRRCMETKEAELVAVGKSLGKVFYKHVPSFGTIQVKVSSGLEILECNVDYQLSRNEAFLDDEENDNGIYCESESAFGLYLPSSECRVLVQVGSDSFVFKAGPDTILVILGQQLEVDDNVKNLPRKLRFMQPVDAQNSASYPLIFSIGLKLDSIIAISDQIMAASLMILLLQLALWIYKCV